jgi:hypothetical protein
MCTYAYGMSLSHKLITETHSLCLFVCASCSSSYNRAPVFTLTVPRVVAYEDTPVKSVVATGIAPSSPDSDPDRTQAESSQKLTFYVTLVSGDASVFAEAPSVDAATGQVSFEPAPNAYGNSTWRIVLADDGGAEKRGHTRGNNVSVAHILAVQVLSVNDAPSFAINKPNMTLLATGFTTAFWEPSVVSEWKAGPPDEEASQTLSFSVQTDARVPASV